MGVIDFLKKNKFLIFLVLILLGALVLRLELFKLVTTEGNQDGYWFMTLGKNFIQTFKYELSPGSPYDKSQPFYSVLIGILGILFKNLFFTGKFISLIFGIATIILTYLFWKRENKGIAILASFFVAFCTLNLFFSVRVMADMLFTFLLLGFFYFFYKSLENKKHMPIAAIFLVLASLTRWEGYLLIFVVLLSWLFLKRKEIFIKNPDGKQDFSFFKNKYCIISLIIILIPLLLWSLRSSSCCGSFIPSLGYQKQLAGSSTSLSLDYIKGIFDYIPWYFLVIAFIGIILSFKNFKRFLPIYLYLIFALIIHIVFRGNSRQFLHVTPLIYGFMALFFIKIGDKLKEKKKYLVAFTIILIIFLGLFAFVEISRAQKMTKEQGSAQDVIKDSMSWLGENSNKSDVVLVGDSIVYSYFISNKLVSYDQANYHAYLLMQKYNLNDPMMAYAVFLYSQNVSYFVAYDSTMSWFYSNTKEFAQAFQEKDYNFNNVTVSLIPEKKFDVNKQEVILYQVKSS